MKQKFITTCIFLALGIAACQNNPRDDDPKDIAEDRNEIKFDKTQIEDDAEFSVAAADGGLMEVELGKLAQSKGLHQQVQDFGAMMVTDHTKANEELKALAAKKNITLPASLSEDKQRKYDDLSAKQASAFDRAYMSFMVKDHKEDIEEFKEQANKGKDMDIKNWASSKIATLEHHLSEATRIDSILSKTK